MKNFIVFAIFALLSSSAFAGNSIKDYTDSVAADMMVRQVVSKKLLAHANDNLYEDLVRALEGSGHSTTRNSLVAIQCERVLGKDQCTISVTGETEGDDEAYMFDLQVTIYQGKVIRAVISNFIG